MKNRFDVGWLPENVHSSGFASLQERFGFDRQTAHFKINEALRLFGPLEHFVAAELKQQNRTILRDSRIRGGVIELAYLPDCPATAINRLVSVQTRFDVFELLEHPIDNDTAGPLAIRIFEEGISEIAKAFDVDLPFYLSTVNDGAILGHGSGGTVRSRAA